MALRQLASAAQPSWVELAVSCELYFDAAALALVAELARHLPTSFLHGLERLGGATWNGDLVVGLKPFRLVGHPLRIAQRVTGRVRFWG